MTYLDEILLDSPYLVWPLDETSGTVAADASGNGRTATYFGSPALADVAGYPDGAAAPTFGIGKGVTSDANVVVAGPSLTIECWFIRNAAIPGQVANLNSLIGAYLASDNGIVARWGDSGPEDLRTYVCVGGVVSTVASTPYGVLTHYVGVCSATSQRTFIDGVEISTTGGYTPSGYNGIFPVASYVDGRYVDASIAWVAIYDTTLSDARIYDHYLAGLGIETIDEIDPGLLSLAGGSVTISPPSIVAVDPGSLILSGGSVSVAAPTSPTIDPGSLGLAGGTVGLSRPLLVTSGELHLTGGFVLIGGPPPTPGFQEPPASVTPFIATLNPMPRRSPPRSVPLPPWIPSSGRPNRKS